jgi:hypothetical protein
VSQLVPAKTAAPGGWVSKRGLGTIARAAPEPQPPSNGSPASQANSQLLFSIGIGLLWVALSGEW